MELNDVGQEPATIMPGRWNGAKMRQAVVLVNEHSQLGGLLYVGDGRGRHVMVSPWVWNGEEEGMFEKRIVQAALTSMGSAQKRCQSSWNSIRSSLTRPGLMPYFLLTSRVRSPCIRSRITRRSRSVRLGTHQGEATAEADWSRE